MVEIEDIDIDYVIKIKTSKISDINFFENTIVKLFSSILYGY